MANFYKSEVITVMREQLLVPQVLEAREPGVQAERAVEIERTVLLVRRLHGNRGPHVVVATVGVGHERIERILPTAHVEHDDRGLDGDLLLGRVEEHPPGLGLRVDLDHQALLVRAGVQRVVLAPGEAEDVLGSLSAW